MDVITFIKMGRLKWAGMSFEWTNGDLQKEFLMPNQKAKEKRGRPKLRWEDGVDNYVKALVERNWKNLAGNRQI
jgi:hypothetical protein